jgi:hypothetical protein
MSFPSTLIVHLYDLEKVWFFKKKLAGKMGSPRFWVQSSGVQRSIQGSGFRGSKVNADPNCSVLVFLNIFIIENIAAREL